MQRRSFGWVVALVGIGLAGVVAVSAATALAARSAASPFELVFQGRWEANWEGDPSYGLPVVLVGTFTSGAPFCESGTADDPTWSRDPVRRRYTCSDGSGSLTLGMTNPLAAYNGIGQGEWTIVEGSGRYAGLRGKGSYTGEVLEQDPEHGGITDRVSDDIAGGRYCGRRRAEPRLHEREREEAAQPCRRVLDPSLILASG